MDILPQDHAQVRPYAMVRCRPFEEPDRYFSTRRQNNLILAEFAKVWIVRTFVLLVRFHFAGKLALETILSALF